MAIPDYQSFMLPILKTAAARDVVEVSPLLTEMADHFGLSADERADLLPSGRQTVLRSRVAWQPSRIDEDFFE